MFSLSVRCDAQAPLIQLKVVRGSAYHLADNQQHSLPGKERKVFEENNLCRQESPICARALYKERSLNLLPVDDRGVKLMGLRPTG